MLVCPSLSVPVQMHACVCMCARAPKVRLGQMQTYDDNFQGITDTTVVSTGDNLFTFTGVYMYWKTIQDLFCG